LHSFDFYSIFVALPDSNKRERKRQDMQQKKRAALQKTIRSKRLRRAKKDK
jgi:hypothetical protein